MNHQDEQLPTRLGRSVIYESLWVNLYRDRVSLPSGRTIERYHFLDFGPGSIAILVENQDRKILMERVARYPTGTIAWELPAGRIEAGESVRKRWREKFEKRQGT